MSKLPQVSGTDVVRALQKLGFTVRETRVHILAKKRETPMRRAVTARAERQGTSRATAHHRSFVTAQVANLTTDRAEQPAWKRLHFFTPFGGFSGFGG